MKCNCWYRTRRLSWIRKANKSLKHWRKQLVRLPWSRTGQWSTPIKSNTNEWCNDAQIVLWCMWHPPLSQQVCTFVFGVPPHIFKEPKWTLIYKLLNNARIYFFLTDMTLSFTTKNNSKNFLLSMFEKVWSKIICEEILHIMCIYGQYCFYSEHVGYLYGKYFKNSKY